MENERDNRLRQQIEELVRSRVGVLEQDISHLQKEFNASFTRLLERTDAAATLPEAEPLIAQLAAQVTAEIDQATTSSVRLIADIALLRDSVSELNEQRNQAEVLNTLVARAANFAPRVVLFVVKGGNALAWAARGFDDNVGNSSIRGLSLSLQSDTALRAAVSAAQTCYGAPDQQSENQLLFSRLGSTQPQRVLVVPLKVRSKAAAIFYADSSDRGESSINVEAIELLVSTAGLVVELVSLRSRLGESGPLKAPHAQPKPAAQEAAAPAPEPTDVAPPVASEPVEASPEVAAPVAPAVAEESGPTPDVEPSPVETAAPQQTEWVEPAFTPAQPWTEPTPAATGFDLPVDGHEIAPAPPVPTFEVTPSAFQPFEMAPAAAAPSEAVTAPPVNVESATPPMLETPAFAYGESFGQASAAPAAPAPEAIVPPEEEKLHNDAKRFARLLVSEIKLYNEQKVVEGRTHRDLYERLKDDIDRSRQMYDKRYGSTAVSSFNYFYNEMVNTLAEGDSAKLGGLET